MLYPNNAALRLYGNSRTCSPRLPQHAIANTDRSVTARNHAAGAQLRRTSNASTSSPSASLTKTFAPRPSNSGSADAPMTRSSPRSRAPTSGRKSSAGYGEVRALTPSRIGSVPLCRPATDRYPPSQKPSVWVEPQLVAYRRSPSRPRAPATYPL